MPLPTVAGGAGPDHCEVLVVGAGPAGGDLAGKIARAGVDVILVDQLRDLSRGAFSSAAVPREAIAGFGIPDAVVAARWSRWRILGPAGAVRDWPADHPLGAVLDFGALRCWLADVCRDAGGRVRLGLRALSCRRQGPGMETVLRGPDGRIRVVRSLWVVDATGHRRALLGTPGRHGPGPSPKGGLLEAVGLEWLVALPLPAWRDWADALTFCLGSDWVPQGYGWVFPMTPGQLKIGVCRYCDPGRSQPPLDRLQRSLIHRLAQSRELGPLRVLDRHGGRVASSIQRREPHLRDGLIGLGDAVSTANLLGGEGIRHALTSSRVLAPLLVEQLDRDRRRGVAGEPGALRRYPRRLRRALGWRWSMSGRIARSTWARLHGPAGDARLERVLRGLEVRRAGDLSALLFDYRFERYGLRSLPYLLGWRRT